MPMEDLRIDIFMHVGGVMKFGRVIRYVGGESLKFGAVDRDKIAYFTLVHFAGALGYGSDRLWYVLPKHSLSAGLRMIHSDKDVNQMVSVASVIGYVNVYVEGHRNASVDRIENDAVDGANGGADVIGSDRRVRKVRGSDVGSEDDSGELSCCIIGSSSSETDDDKSGVGKNGQMRMEVEHQVVGNEDLGQNSKCKDSGDHVMMWNLDEETTRKRSRSHASVRFDPKCDPGDLVFTVGLTFDDEDQFKEAVRAHSAYYQADVCFARSSGESMEAKCVDGCPWRVRAGWQWSKSEFVVEMSELKHKCSKGERLVKSLYLSSRLNEAKENTEDDVSELKKPEKPCRMELESTRPDAPALYLASRPADSKDQESSVEQVPAPSGQSRLLGLRKKSEVRRGGMHSTISRRGRV